MGRLSAVEIAPDPIVFDKNRPPEIIMFSSQSCHYCDNARQFFNKYQLSYTENDIDISDKHRQMFSILGGKGTPLIIVNKEIIHGFDEDRIRKAL